MTQQKNYRAVKNRITHENEEVDKMLKEWDMIRCKICGKKITMLEAEIIRTEEGYEYFVCPEHRKNA